MNLGNAHFQNIYETKPDPRRPGRIEYVCVCANERAFYADFLKGLGLDKEKGLPGQNDRKAWPMMKKRCQAIFLTKTRDEWAEIFRGMDFHCQAWSKSPPSVPGAKLGRQRSGSRQLSSGSLPEQIQD